ncbi:hypothetical protein FB451DRAFT_1185819 [Mycena latifolia]|nr:hypothetical protein FB451DRAFT_1185819 [Mycena latifolia]
MPGVSEDEMTTDEDTDAVLARKRLGTTPACSNKPYNPHPRSAACSTRAGPSPFIRSFSAGAEVSESHGTFRRNEDGPREVRDIFESEQYTSTVTPPGKCCALPSREQVGLDSTKSRRRRDASGDISQDNERVAAWDAQVPPRIRPSLNKVIEHKAGDSSPSKSREREPLLPAGRGAVGDNGTRDASSAARETLSVPAIAKVLELETPISVMLLQTVVAEEEL